MPFVLIVSAKMLASILLLCAIFSTPSMGQAVDQNINMDTQCGQSVELASVGDTLTITSHGLVGERPYSSKNNCILDVQVIMIKW